MFPQLLSVAMTDLHSDVVKAAKSNILSATEKADDRLRNVALGAVARAGDILLPLKDQEPFDLIYELVWKELTYLVPRLIRFVGTYLISPFRTRPTSVVVKPHQPILATANPTIFRTSSRQLSSTFTTFAYSKPKLLVFCVARGRSFQVLEEGFRWRHF